MAESRASCSTVELSVAATPRNVASSALRRLASSNARRVVDGDGGLRGDRLSQTDLVRREAPRVARLGDVEHAEYLVAVDERHGEGRLLAPGGHLSEVLEREAGVVVVHGLRHVAVRTAAWPSGQVSAVKRRPSQPASEGTPGTW